MTPTDTVFCCASDSMIEELISAAQRRLVIVSPALTERVSKAVLDRIPSPSMTNGNGDRDGIEITVVLDDNAEAYRIGYGTAAKLLDEFRRADDKSQVRFRVERGVRIGVVISDDDALIFSPTPQLVEEPVTESMAKPNGIMLSAREAERIARVCGWSPAAASSLPDDPSAIPSFPTTPEIGVEPFTAAAVSSLTRDLGDNPPEPLDLSRRIRVFSSKVKYVELRISNVRISTRKAGLPPELLGIANDDLKERIDSQLRPPPELSEPLSIEIETADGKRRTKNVDEKWIGAERRRVEDEYTFTVPKYGRLIFHTAWDGFRAETERLKRNLHTYHAALTASAEASRAAFVRDLVDEFLPTLKRNPPRHLTRYRGGGKPSDADLRWYLEREIERLASKVITIPRPEVRVVRKDVAPESLREQDFINGIEERLPPHEVERLFTNRAAVPSGESAAAVRSHRPRMSEGPAQ